jgi:hypothetical protein
MAAQVVSPFADHRPVRSARRIEVTVGPAAADFVGCDHRVIQAAIEYVAALGGGTVQLLAGTYALGNAIFPRAGVTIRGMGDETVLKKRAGTATALVREADWFEYAVQVENPAGFTVGGGLSLSSGKAEWPQTKCFTITAIEDNVLYLDQRTEKNFWMAEEARAESVHSLIRGWEVDDVCIENLVLDGARDCNPLVNGNYLAGVFMQYCNRWRFAGVTCQNYNGDGFSFQVCDDIQFRRCRALGNATLGFHPGSGAQRPVFQDCESRGNGLGLFWCWGVCDGVAEDCVFVENTQYGSSVGHRDTDNVMRRCRFERNGVVGVLFRDEPEPSRTPDRNRLEACEFVANGEAGVDIQGTAGDIVVQDCRFAGDGDSQPVGIRIAAAVGEVELSDNEFVGITTTIEDNR